MHRPSLTRSPLEATRATRRRELTDSQALDGIPRDERGNPGTHSGGGAVTAAHALGVPAPSFPYVLLQSQTDQGQRSRDHGSSRPSPPGSHSVHRRHSLPDSWIQRCPNTGSVCASMKRLGQFTALDYFIGHGTREAPADMGGTRT